MASGLNQALTILNDIDDIKLVWFDKIDVVRHPLVQKILERYEANENNHTQSNK